MSLKQEIETWVSALARYDNNEFDEALKEFDGIADTSKILFNCGVIHATLGEHEKAVECYQKAVRLDQYLAVAYFQQGVSNFLVGDFEEALANFNDTLLYLRGNNMIDYAQLGLLFKLYSCEVLFNRGLCYMYLQQKEAGLQDFSFAVKEKVVEDHNVIDEAIRDEAEGYTVFSIPVGVVYRPNQAKVKNLKTKDYLGKARLVAASDRANAFTGFAGSEIKNAGIIQPKDDRPMENLSYAAANLVKPGLASKRQQSEPPLNRNVFPPTPPPEIEKPSGPPPMSRGASHVPTKAMRSVNVTTGEVLPKHDPDAEPSEQHLNPEAHHKCNTPAEDPNHAPDNHQEECSQRKEEDDDYPEDLYDMYTSPSRRSNNSRRNTRNRYIEEESEYASDYDEGSFDEDEFEMVSSRPPPRSRTTSSINGGNGRAGSRQPDVRKVRVKVHAEDVRYIMIGSAIEFRDFQDKIKEKFGLRDRFKIKDDLDMVLLSVKANAKRERLDMGKMEIWVVKA
ncbi:hypothetical protein DID88_004810 [Monilinia fructigena]|uniref:Uncharacterized protein n=1 Tax=Monilinia fructigena TaxID=38457 RepID=A0A395IPM4_9HELO|nr:hypothetical protein DID88_004810 [Monilinia fructigena]